MPSYPIRAAIDVYGPRLAVDKLALKLGFPRNERQELAIVVSELSSNIVKYGIRGSIELETVDDPEHGVGIAIIARDEGPAFHDFWMATQDGCDDRGPIDPAQLLHRNGLGIGLGAVLRLTDSLDVQQGANGKAIRAVRYLQRPRARGTTSII